MLFTNNPSLFTAVKFGEYNWIFNLIRDQQRTIRFNEL